MARSRCSGQACTAAPVIADRSPSTWHPSADGCARSRRTAPAGGNAAASIERIGVWAVSTAAGAVADQRQSRCSELKLGCVRSNSPSTGSSSSEWKAWLVSSQVQRIPLVVVPVDQLLKSAPGPDSTVLGPFVGGHRHSRELAGNALDIVGVGEPPPSATLGQAAAEQSSRVRPSAVRRPRG